MIEERWQEAYQKLRGFISGNPEIEVSSNFTVIPGEVRPEFYRLFDDVKIGFLKEYFPLEVTQAEALSENYIKAEQTVIALLNLENIATLDPLHRFLHEPKAELNRALTDPLFDLLKGNIDTAGFTKIASGSIGKTFKDSFRTGYAKWVALSFIKALEADKLLNVEPPESKLSPHGEPHHYEKPVPHPEESKILSFEHGPHLYPPFILPHFIIHSARLNRYVSVRTELLTRAEYTADNASPKKQWLSYESMEGEYNFSMRNPSLLVYIADEPETLALVVDRFRVCRPDLILECRLPEDWYEGEHLTEGKLFDMLDPHLGRFVVSAGPVPEQLTRGPASLPSLPELDVDKLLAVDLEKVPEEHVEKLEQTIVYDVTADFDPSDLETVIEAMADYQIPAVDEKIQAPAETRKISPYCPD